MHPRFGRHIQLRDAQTSECVWEGPIAEAAIIVEQLPQGSVIADKLSDAVALGEVKQAHEEYVARVTDRSKDNQLPQEARAVAAAELKQAQEQKTRASQAVGATNTRIQEARAKVRK